MTDPVTDLDADSLSQTIHAREVSCREVMQAYLARIRRLNPQLGALVNPAPDAALLAQADQRDADLAPAKTAHGSRGWMHGMPQAIKDAAHAAGFPSTLGSPLLRTAVASVDGVMAARMKAAGCIVIAKTSAEDMSTHAVSPVSTFSTGAAPPAIADESWAMTTDPAPNTKAPNITAAMVSAAILWHPTCRCVQSRSLFGSVTCSLLLSGRSTHHE